MYQYVLMMHIIKVGSWRRILPMRGRVIALLLVAYTVPGQRAALEARFIGNMAFAISDGSATIVTDFPYQSGAFGYMSYDRAEIRSATASTLALITHRHDDHWNRSLFATTRWHVAGPDDVVAGLELARVVALAPGTTGGASSTRFGQAQIEAIRTPHASVGHYSYVVTWHGRRLYFSGDTERVADLVALRNLDVAFVSPWLFRAVQKAGARIEAKQVVIYHHQSSETVPECVAPCLVPKQGTVLPIR